MELKQKGINDEIIQFQISIRQLADKFQIGSDLELAKKIVEKKLPQLAGGNKKSRPYSFRAYHEDRSNNSV